MVLGALLAPLTQYLGTHHGALLAPDSLKPLFGTDAFVAALHGFARLASFSPPIPDVGDPAASSAYCTPWGSANFHRGRCAMTLGYGHVFKVGGLGQGLAGSQVHLAVGAFNLERPGFTLERLSPP